MKTLKDQGFLFRDMGNKLDYGVFHKTIDNGETLVCWMRKNCVEKEDLEEGKFKASLNEDLKFKI